MKPETNAKLHKACADLAKEITPYLTGFAPYTPVTVSARTFPYQGQDRDGGPLSSLNGALLIHVDSETLALPPTKIDDLDRRVAETIRDLSDDGFNPFGSGPEPIGPRE